MWAGILHGALAVRSSLGVSVPVPLDTEQVVEAIFEGVLSRGHNESKVPAQQQLLPGFDVVVHDKRDELFKLWDVATERESTSRRTVFAQHSIKTDEVEREPNAVQNSIGLSSNVAHFTKESSRRSASLAIRNVSVGPQLPPDVLSMYVYLPIRD